MGFTMNKNQGVLYNPTTDFYKLLGVASSATTDEIRQVYRRRAKEVHPDHNPNRELWAEQQFRQINEAYTILSDPELRTEYDRQRYFYLYDAFQTKSATPPRQSQRYGQTNWSTQSSWS